MRALAAIVLTAIPVLASCGSPARATNDADSVTVRVSGRPLLTNAPILIADAAGYFAEQRIRLEWAETSQSTAQSIPVLAQGKIDVIAGVVSSGLLNAQASGAPIRIVADKGHQPPNGCPIAELIVRRPLAQAGEVTTLAHLRGRKLATNDVGISGYYNERKLASVGLTFDDVTLVKLPHSVMLDALNSGSIDVASAPEPWRTAALDAGHVAIPVPAVTEALQSAVVVYGPTMARDKPDVGKRFMVAYLKGVRQYGEGKTARNLDLLAPRLNVTRDVLARMCWQDVRADGRVNTKSIMDFQRWAIAKGLLRSSVPENELWDSSFVAQARQTLATESEVAP